MSANADVAIVGGGIIGCALAAFLAEDGARVRLYEREEVAAGASGRNSGLLQHPMDEALTDIFAASEALYAELGHGFELPPEVVGVLVVGEDAAALEPIRAEIAGQFPELAAEALDAPHELEPALAEDLAGFRLDTGRPVPPAAATRAFAARAREAGAEIREGVRRHAAHRRPPRRPRRRGSARRKGRSPPARWSSPPARGAPRSSTPPAPGGRSRRRGASTSSSASATPPRHSIEETGIESLKTAGGVTGPLFSIVTRGGVSALGSTFLPEQPDPAELAPALLERGTRFIPQLAGTHAASVRACARPASADGRPLLGPLATQGLFVATGHGPWGVSLGPGSARLVADAVLGKPAKIPPELAATRF